MPTTAATYVSHIRGWHEIHTGVKLGLFHNSDTKQGPRFSKLIRGLKHQTGYKVGRKKAVLLHHVADLIQLYKTRWRETQACVLQLPLPLPSKVYFENQSILKSLQRNSALNVALPERLLNFGLPSWNPPTASWQCSLPKLTLMGRNCAQSCSPSLPLLR